MYYKYKDLYQKNASYIYQQLINQNIQLRRRQKKVKQSMSFKLGDKMGLTIYNTLSNKKEKFVPLEEGKVKLYLCGPTVYGYLHIGNFRGPITFNLIRNWLEFCGNEVTFV
mgnify:CR=1 FL=1